MDQIIWQNQYSVGVAEIDKQHQQFMAIMNKIYDVLTSEKKNSSIRDLLVELFEYTKYHFGTEEKYFEKYKYPEAQKHINAHKNLVNTVKEFMNKQDIDTHELGFELLDFLEDWLVDHLYNMDKKYTKWFNDHGLK